MLLTSSVCRKKYLYIALTTILFEIEQYSLK